MPQHSTAQTGMPHSDANSNCVVLVPTGGAIVPGCEEALLELEKRGYTIRRVRGFSQIDVARCQMASDALADGFDELMWIDSDVVFNPADVDRLRMHGAPFVCGVYAKKSRREFACSFLPGTGEVLFGQGGGVIEIQYAGFGFVLTRRGLYEQMQQQLKLPVCNEKFGSTLIPYFMPLSVADGNGSWYLGEDYAFCERARQCGVRILLDTTIRLWHVGTYPFGWEDAGSDKDRFATFSFTTVMPRSPETGETRSVISADPALTQFAAMHPWPAERPSVAPNLKHGWLSEGAKALLAATLAPQTRIVVELGAWLGLSTRFIAAQAPQATVISVDGWEGSDEQRKDQNAARFLPQLYERFLTNSWNLKDRLLPLRMSAQAGFEEIAKSGLRPDIIYIGAQSSYEGTRAVLITAARLFPFATIVGADWEKEGVQRAAKEAARQSRRKLEANSTAWIMRAATGH